MGIVRPVMTVYPYAWAFFVPFILIVTFAVMNLFIAIIVNAMHEEAQAADDAAAEAAAHMHRAAGGPDRARALAALERMESEIGALRAELNATALNADSGRPEHRT